MCLRIQALLLVSRGNRESDVHRLLELGGEPFRIGYTGTEQRESRGSQKDRSRAQNLD